MNKKQLILLVLLVSFAFFVSCIQQTGNVVKNITLENKTVPVENKSVTEVSIDFGKINLSEVCFPDEKTVKEIFGENVNLDSFCIVNRKEAKKENRTEIKTEVVSERETEIKLDKDVVKEVLLNETKAQQIIEKAEYVKTIVINETEEIKLNITAVDPDGDPLKVIFSYPFDQNGYWKTTYGDYGEYIVNITVTDGKDNVTQRIKLVVLKKDLPPEVDVPEVIKIKEGEFLDLEKYIKVRDVHNDPIQIYYSGWLDGPRYNVTYFDAGKHYVKIIVSDGTYNVTNYLTIDVENVNRLPIVELKYPEKARGLDVVKIEINATDPDLDNLTISFSKPFDENGTWSIPKLANGTYKFKVFVSDGYDEVVKEGIIEVTRYNTLPKILLENMIISEDTELNFAEFVVDDEGDEVKLKIIGDINESKYYFDYFSAGKYNITLTACDYEGCTNKTVTLEVLNKNRKPIIEIEDKFIIEETQNLTLKPKVYDLDGEKVKYVCYLDDKELEGCNIVTDYDWSGNYKVTIVASDGIDNTTKEVFVKVLNKNREPIITNVTDITVKEGETIVISPVIIDPDNDKVDWWLDGWLKEPIYQTTYEDAGQYKVKIVASDGEAVVEKEIIITVVDVNRPPVIKDIIVN
ncbi:MAG: hypothetical protein QXR30_00780 [Candidatus Woesearchaeota archaeon]